MMSWDGFSSAVHSIKRLKLRRSYTSLDNPEHARAANTLYDDDDDEYTSLLSPLIGLTLDEERKLQNGKIVIDDNNNNFKEKHRNFHLNQVARP